jgi:hypothetical protein
MNSSTSPSNDENTDKKKLPFFNRRKVVVPFFLVGGLVLLPAGFYGSYCYFTSATTFFNLIPNCLLTVHSNILTNIFTPCIAGFLGITGVLCFLSFVVRCISWHKGYFNFRYSGDGYYLPDNLNINEEKTSLVLRICARLSGLVPYKDTINTEQEIAVTK